MATTKRATKKALETFCTSNNITPDSILDKLTTQYPDKYISSEELAHTLIRGLFKEYDEVNDTTITDYLKQLDEGDALHSYTVEYRDYFEYQERLTNLLVKIKADVMKRDVRLSSYPEWTTDLQDFIRREYTWNCCYTEDGKYAFGKTFYSFFSFWHYDHGYPPFHCYGTKDGNDVLFTKTKHQWIESKGCYDFETTSTNSGCMGMLIVIISSTLLVACSLL